ncbi:MAG: hypothetical protein ACI9T8_000238 [Candidatus Saccharimonadales bacterium]|jgi:hypothetical protein
MDEQTPSKDESVSTAEQPEKQVVTQVKSNSVKHKLALPKKPMMMAAALAVLALGGIVGFLLMNNSDDTENVPEVVEVVEQQKVTTLGASIATIEGTVEYSSDGANWVQAVGGESLANLDYVRTTAASRAIILMDDGSVVRLDSGTELYLSSLEIGDLEVTLVNGQVYSRVVESENQTFTVVTANERFQALGTAYKTSTDGDKDTLEVYQSKVKVESDDLEVGEGNKYDTEKKEKEEIDLASLSEDEFAQWNKDKDSAKDEFKDKLGVLGQEVAETPAPAAPSSSASAGITLSASATDSGVELSWSLSGVSAPNGFKVVRDKSNTSPSYGEHSAQYVGKDSTSYKWYDEDGQTHHYRVCIYRDGGACDTYSNSVQVASPFVEKEPVATGTINLTIDSNVLSWSLVGGTAPHGFKVVLSETAGPVYPTHAIKYVGSEKTSVELPEKAVGTYYVRICKYTNGTQDAGCVDYSNEVEYVVTE